MNNSWTIVLSNGRTLPNLSINGNNFISGIKVDETTFADGLDKVTFQNDNDNDIEIRFNMRLVQVTQVDDMWWFILAEKTPGEIRLEDLEAATRQIMLTMVGGISHV